MVQSVCCCCCCCCVLGVVVDTVDVAPYANLGLYVVVGGTYGVGVFEFVVNENDFSMDLVVVVLF